MAKKFSKDKKPSVLNTAIENKRRIENFKTSNFKVSLQDFDSSQKCGSSYRDWQKCGLLSKMFETLSGYCCRPLLEQVDGAKFTLYGDFPPKERTKFKYPEHVPEDANWARIHIEGAAVIAGHVLENTFYIVFLDKCHSFYMTKRKAKIK